MSFISSFSPCFSQICAYRTRGSPNLINKGIFFFMWPSLANIEYIHRKQICPLIYLEIFCRINSHSSKLLRLLTSDLRSLTSDLQPLTSDLRPPISNPYLINWFISKIGSSIETTIKPTSRPIIKIITGSSMDVIIVIFDSTSVSRLPAIL